MYGQLGFKGKSLSLATAALFLNVGYTGPFDIEYRGAFNMASTIITRLSAIYKGGTVIYLTDDNVTRDFYKTAVPKHVTVSGR
jgi:hypothetical protein